MSGQGLMIEAWRQGLMKRPCRSAANWFAFMAFPAWLLTALLAASWGIALPTVTWAFSCQSFMKEMHHRLAHRLIWWAFSQPRLPLLKWLWVCQDDINPTAHCRLRWVRGAVLTPALLLLHLIHFIFSVGAHNHFIPRASLPLCTDNFLFCFFRFF